MYKCTDEQVRKNWRRPGEDARDAVQRLQRLLGFMFVGAWHEYSGRFAPARLRFTYNPWGRARQFCAGFLDMIEDYDIDVVRAFRGENMRIGWARLKGEWQHKSRIT